MLPLRFTVLQQLFKLLLYPPKTEASSDFFSLKTTPSFSNQSLIIDSQVEIASDTE